MELTRNETEGDRAMTRPRAEHPTPGELEILKVLWDRGAPATVREVMEVVNGRGGPPRADRKSVV